MAAIALAGCLDRDNPFDPLNRISPDIPKIRVEEKPRVDSMASAGLGQAGEIDMYAAAFRRDSLANDSLVKANQGRHRRNDSVRTANAFLDSANAIATDPDALRNLSDFVALEELDSLGPYPDLDRAVDRVAEAAARIEGLMASTNRREYPLEIYPKSYLDSVLGPLWLKSAELASLVGRIEAENQSIAAANGLIRAYNDSVRSWNQDVSDYNALLEFRRRSLKNGVITHADSLDKATQTARPGDTLLVGPGEYPGDLRFASGTPDARIVIRGYPGWKTVLRPRATGDTAREQAAILSGNSDIRFEDLVFRGGAISGIKLQSSSRRISFKRCLFDSNAVRGIDATTSDLELIDCEIRDNGGGIRVEMASGSNFILRLDNVLIARNRGHGIEAVTPAGEISNTTISDNAGEGLHIAAHQRSLAVTNSILSFNSRYGIYRDATPQNADGLTVKQTLLWENGANGEGGNWSLVNLDSANALALMQGNWEDRDPGFVDHLAGEYTLREDSWLAELEKLPLIIGYRRKP